MKDLDFTKSEKIEFIYDVCAGIISVMAVIIVMIGYSVELPNRERKIVNILDNIVYWIFVFDYVIRFMFYKDKKKFLKYNIVDLIAIIPFMYISTFEFSNFFKLIRVVTYLIRLLNNIREILFTSGFIYALGVVTIITLLGAMGIYFCEVNINAEIKSFEDALWWSIVTVTTVGYGDIIVISGTGKIIACMLMFTGVSFISMLTSTMSTYLIARLKKKGDYKLITLEDTQHKEIIDLSRLTEENNKNIINYYNYLINMESQREE